MGHEYGAQPEQVVKPEEEEMSANTSDSESEIKVEKQDSTEQAGEVDISSSGDHGDILEERDEALPPKVNAETVTVKEGVSKQVIKEGHGLGPPPRHSSCFVHYRAWTASTLHKFDDTWAEQQPQELRLGHEKKVLKGLAIGVGSMKIGERALLHINHSLAYGKEGSFSFPNVPPATDVMYEVELIGYEEPREGRPPGEMVVEERIEAADRRKVDGNELFKEGKIAEAMQQYEMALAYMGDDFMFQLFGKYHDMAIAVKNPCHLNLAACMLKIHRFEEAIGHCSVVLAEDPKNTKALFRRGKARAELGQTDAAKDDFEKARKLEPDNKEVIRELRLIAKQERELYDKQREMYKGLFKPAPVNTPHNNPTHWYSKLWQWVAPVLHYFSKFRRSKRE